MKHATLLLFIFMVSSLISAFTIVESGSASPEIFAPQIISTMDDEGAGTFTPDGKDFFFTKKSPSTQRSNIVTICQSSLVNGKWSTPVIAPFASDYKDFNPFITADGSRFYFVSTRPIDDKPKYDADIWFMDKQGAAWGKPERLSSVINTPAYEQSLSVAANGTVYFCSGRDSKSLDIYRSRLVNGEYQEPENLGEAINSAINEVDVFISPDERFLLFSCTGREDAIVAKQGAGYPRSDLYISYNENGKWTQAKNLGPAINSEADEASPWMAKDGKTLFFISKRNFASTPIKKKLTYEELTKSLRNPANGLGDVYSVNFEAVKP